MLNYYYNFIKKTHAFIRSNKYDPAIVNVKACVRGMRITVSLFLNFISKGMDKSEILGEYSSLVVADIDRCVKYDDQKKKQ